MIAMKRSYEGGIVIAGKRSARSFGHWNDQRPSARPDAVQPDTSIPTPPAPATRPPASSAGPHRGDPLSPGHPERSQISPGDDTRTRLQLLAQRREDGELMRELADPADAEHPASPSATTRDALRTLADRRLAATKSPETPAEDGEERLWNLVLGAARPLLNPPGDRPAR
jgi:hypothetical protein